MAFAHDIGLTWFECAEPGCDYKCKQKSHLKTHMALTHDIGLTWYFCDMCDYKCKQNGGLTRHIKSLHYNVYCERKKIQEERVRIALLTHGWVEYVSGDTLPPKDYFKREHYINFKCAQASTDHQFCRIDFVLGYGASYIFLEVDEHQHKFGDNGTLSCDARRMANVMASITIEFSKINAGAPPIYWLRYNPHEFKVMGTTFRITKDDREKRLCKFLDEVEPFNGIAYSFYDYDDEGLNLLKSLEFPEYLKPMVQNLGSFG
jgi:hypothetical protein